MAPELPIPAPRKRSEKSKRRLELQMLARSIKEDDQFLVLTHLRPDGDAVGSAVALARGLCQLGKDVVLWHSEGVPSSYGFLQGEWALEPPADTGDRFAIVVDCGSRERVADTLPDGSGLLEQADFTAQLDHHQTNPRFTRFNCVWSELPATAQLLPLLFSFLGVKISAEIAAPLYVGLYTDTGGFRFRSVSDETLALRDELGKVVDTAELDQLLTDYPASWVAYAERCAARVVALDPEVALAVMTASDLLECEVEPGAVQQACSRAKERLQQTDALFHVFVYEQLDGRRFVTLRCQSEIVHADEIAASFGGGGHRSAAGFQTELEPSQLTTEIFAAYRAARFANPAA